DSDGRAVEGVDIRVAVSVRNLELGGRAARSDVEGWFELRVPRSMDPVRLNVTGGEVLPDSFTIARFGPVPVLTVSRRAKVRLAWASVERGATVTAHFPDGRRAMIHYP